MAKKRPSGPPVTALPDVETVPYLGYHTTINPTSIRGLPRRLLEQISNRRDREAALAIWEEQRLNTDTPEYRMRQMEAHGVFGHPDNAAELIAAAEAPDEE